MATFGGDQGWFKKIYFMIFHFFMSKFQLYTQFQLLQTLQQWNCHLWWGSVGGLKVFLEKYLGFYLLDFILLSIFVVKVYFSHFLWWTDYELLC